MNQSDELLKLGPDWSCGPWEARCQTRLVRQRAGFDCGVACLAMVCQISYESARATFEDLGLGQGRRPLSSNFVQLQRALCRHGLLTARRRWRGWADIEGLGVLKVASVREDGSAEPRHWHWVVVEAHPDFGVVVRDPASPLVAFERPPMDIWYRELRHLQPRGAWIAARPSSEARPAARLEATR